jgi:hypothetical protein
MPETGLVDVINLDGTGLACEASTTVGLSGKIALIAGGGCSSHDKVTNVAEAGAVAAIIYNPLTGAGPIALVGLRDTTIPALMVSNEDGLALKEYADRHPGLLLEIDDTSALTEKASTSHLTPFSSRGPSVDYILKPDLVAVGENIYSAAQNNRPSGHLYSESQFALGHGVSFSTAMVSGAAAVIRQLQPDLDPQGVKSALVSTANPDMTVDGHTRANVLESGGGLLDMGAAAEAAVTFDPPTLSFGIHSYQDRYHSSLEVVIRNISSTEHEYQLSIEPIIEGPSLSLDSNTTGTIPPGGGMTVELELEVETPLTGGYQGFLVARSVSTGKVYRVPYWAGIYRFDRERVLTVSQDEAGAGEFGGLSEAILDAHPGNIIEIRDDGSYEGGLILATNLEGLPLNGITIRAAEGKSPVLDGAEAYSWANVEVRGLENILLQGLKIEGAEIGVMLSQPSQKWPSSVAIDQCTVLGSERGILVFNGGNVDVTHSTIADSAGPGIDTWPGTQLSVCESGIVRNGDAGIDAWGSNLMIMSSNVSESKYVGGVFSDCVGVIRESGFIINGTIPSNGMKILGGELTLDKCIFDSNLSGGVFCESFFPRGDGPIVIIKESSFHSDSLVVDAARRVLLEANRIEESYLRIQNTSNVLMVNNIITSMSIDPQGAQVINNSIYNGGLVNNATWFPGSHNYTGPDTEIFNCISNGEVRGFSNPQMMYSLTLDGSIGGATNIAADPLFAAPAVGNCDLLPGSPAIEAGWNEAPALPFLDFYGRLRVAGESAVLPGDGTVDMGAVESSSKYPLVIPLLAEGELPGIGETLTTGVAMWNDGDRSTHATIAAFGIDGTLMSGESNPATLDFGPGEQLPILGFQLFGYPAGSPRQGAILASSDHRLKGLFLLFDEGFQRFADGVGLGNVTARDLIFMKHQNNAEANTVYALFNPNPSPAMVQATLYGKDGTAVGNSVSSLILQKGQWVFSFDKDPASSGYVHIESERPVFGLQIFGNSSELGALKAQTVGTDGRLFFPHFAVNEGFSTFIGIINRGDSTAAIRLRAYSSAGRPIGDPVFEELKTGEQLYESVAEVFDLGSEGLVTGYIVAEATQGGLLGFTFFRYSAAGATSIAAVPAASVPQQRLLFSHVAHQVPAGSGGTYQTGIALLNPFGAPAAYELRVFDGAGEWVASKEGVLAPRQKIAKILSHAVPGAGYFDFPLAMGSGHIEVVTRYGLLGFELFFTEDFSQLASVPAQ